MSTKSNIKIAFYGDDFTGSTDALEFLSKAGLRTILFLDIPTENDLECFDKLDAIGIAGLTRAMPPKEMSKTLQTAFEKIKEFNPRHVHYKVCSTFDSSPEIGNIGVAIEEGRKLFNSLTTPVLVAAPHLGRYSAFGNLYARMGIGSKGKIYRLDRHPSMSKHPTTPAHEADLRKHLTQQSDRKMGLLDLTALDDSFEHLLNKWNSEVLNGAEVIFVDAMYEHQMKKIGQLLDSLANESSPLFTVGSSGVGKALGDYWNSNSEIAPKNNWKILEKADPILVVSGSVSPVTADQIKTAIKHGFVEFPISPEILLSKGDQQPLIEDAVKCLKKGKSVLLHTSVGPEDERIDRVKEISEELNWSKTQSRLEIPKHFGKFLGQTAKKILQQQPLKRIVIAGGDTSSYVARELGIQAVEMIAPFLPGAPICRAFAPNSPVDGIEVNIKGGQMGDKFYFVNLKENNTKNLEP